MTRASQLGDGWGTDLSYTMRSSAVPGRRGSLRAQQDDGWITLTLDGMETCP